MTENVRRVEQEQINGDFRYKDRIILSESTAARKYYSTVTRNVTRSTEETPTFHSNISIKL
jgi:hypothetical protein